MLYRFNFFYFSLFHFFKVHSYLTRFELFAYDKAEEGIT